MKKVLTPKFKELFKYQSSLNELWDFEKEFSIYNPFTVSFMLSALLLFLGIFNRYALFMGFALAASLIAIYFILKNQSKRIYLKRSVPSSSTEYKEVKAKINIRNNSPFPIFDYSLIDTYTGSQVGNKTIKSSGSIAPYKSKRLLQKWENDGGMGEKYFESLIIEIRDPLEMICFPILEDKVDAISIYPHHERTPPIPVEFNISSAHYGEIDIPKRGESINFMGIRDYRKGDPVKRINWKQTAKQKKPIINLFERNINKSIILLYNNALELHSGLAAQSTEEYIKDLILSIAADNISNGNHLKLITHEHSTPWGAERSFINRLELFLLDLKLTHKGRPHKFLEETLSREVGKDLRQSSIFYLTPLVAHPSTEETFEYILTLENLGVPIKIMAINPYSFVDKHFQYGNFSGVKGHIVAAQKLIEKWRPIFRKRGISFFVIDINPKLSLNEKVQKAWRDFEAKI